jgi:small subunit ribosomal protein S6e
MVFKLNISDPLTGKSWKLESNSDSLVGKKLGEAVSGKELSPDLSGYELTITGASDFAGFPHKSDIEGTELNRVLLTKGWGMHKKPRKEGKKPVSTPHGLRLRKTLRGNQISEKTIQININVEKAGAKKLEEIFPDQNTPKEQPKAEEKSLGTTTISQPQKQTDNNQVGDSEQKKEEKPMESTNEKAEEIKEEIKEEVAKEIKDEIPTSPETKTQHDKEEAAEKVAEEVAEEVEEAAEEIAKEEKKE